MIVDANILLYAVDSASPHHSPAARWVEKVLNGSTRVGLPVQTLTAFARVASHARAMANPLSAHEAAGFVDAWLATPVAWVPPMSHSTWAVAQDFIRRYHATGNVVPDAALAALAVEHGVPLVSADSDFARFREVRWVNPLLA